MLRLIFSFCLLISFTGCTSIYSRMSYELEAQTPSSNNYYEKGAEDLAQFVNDHLDNLIKEVEASQFRPFKAPEKIKVFLFNDKERYSNYSLASVHSRGSSTTDEIYISPIIRERINTFSSIIKHELSHVHIRQYVGTWRYINNIPGWFHEGLAVEVSDGGGAEKVSVQAAIDMIKQGKHFTPRPEGGVFGHHTAYDYGLKPHMYYRQAGLFVRFLNETDPDSFKKSYLDLTEGASFASVWEKNYGKNLDELWNHFLKTRQL